MRAVVVVSVERGDMMLGMEEERLMKNVEPAA